MVLLFISGAAVVLYPAVSDLWNSQWNNRMKSIYDKSVNLYSEDTLKDEWSKAIKTHPYSDLLNPSKNGIMGYVEIPKIDQEIIIYHGTSSKSLERGAGHVEGTSLPIGGKSTHAVIAAHRGLPGAKLFTDLDQLKKGDNFYLRILDKKLAYRVDQIKTVKPEELSDLQITEGKDFVTLLTCTPYGVNTHRLMVRGNRVPYEDHNGVRSPLMVFLNSWQFKLMVAVAVIVIALIFMRKQRKRSN